MLTDEKAVALARRACNKSTRAGAFGALSMFCFDGRISGAARMDATDAGNRVIAPVEGRALRDYFREHGPRSSVEGWRGVVARSRATVAMMDHWPVQHGPLHEDAYTDRDPRYPVYLTAEDVAEIEWRSL